MFGYGPCRKVRCDGITGVIGCADPDRVMAECPDCEHKCQWWDRIEKNVAKTMRRMHEPLYGWEV